MNQKYPANFEQRAYEHMKKKRFILQFLTKLELNEPEINQHFISLLTTHNKTWITSPHTNINENKGNRIGTKGLK